MSVAASGRFGAADEAVCCPHIACQTSLGRAMVMQDRASCRTSFIRWQECGVIQTATERLYTSIEPHAPRQALAQGDQYRVSVSKIYTMSRCTPKRTDSSKHPVQGWDGCFLSETTGSMITSYPLASHFGLYLWVVLSCLWPFDSIVYPSTHIRMTAVGVRAYQPRLVVVVGPGADAPRRRVVMASQPHPRAPFLLSAKTR
jgi:hypothetical protein